MESELDLSYLSDKERRRVQAVLERDAQIQKKEEQRLERLKNKAQKTKNPIILKKIRMRSGQWFIDLQLKSKFRKRGVDTVRQSIRFSKSRRDVSDENSSTSGSRVDLSSITPAITPNQRVSPSKTPQRQNSSDSRLAPPSHSSSITLPSVQEDDQNIKEEKPEEKETNDQVAPKVNLDETPVTTLDKEPDPVEETSEVIPEKPDLIEETPEILPEKPQSSESESENVVEEKVAEVVEIIEDNNDDVIITEEINESILEVIEEKVEENEEATVTVEPVVVAAPLEDIAEEPEVVPESPTVEIAVVEQPSSGAATPKKHLGSTQSLNYLKPKKSTSMLSLASQKSGLFSSCVSVVTGDVNVGLKYDDKKSTLLVNIVDCSDLSMVDGKPPTPYVKTYLLPDKAKASKKKTKVKKKTCDPVYNETLKYKISRSELETRVLNVAVWHDKVGINTFLGEANIHMLDQEEGPAKYELMPKMDENQAGSQGWMSDYYGEIEITMRFQCETSRNVLTDSDVGQLDAVIKKIKNVPSQNKNPCNIFIKGYFLPDHHRQTKQKSPVVTSQSDNSDVTFDHLFSYTNVQVSDLKHRCLELRCFNQSKIGKHKLIGGVRIGSGSGMSLNEPVEWMDSNISERSLWDGCLQTPNTWIEGQLDLRKLPPSK